jgi:hypothetical protein
LSHADIRFEVEAIQAATASLSRKLAMGSGAAPSVPTAERMQVIHALERAGWRPRDGHDGNALRDDANG